jgi:hypothetical protein
VQAQVGRAMIRLPVFDLTDEQVHHPDAAPTLGEAAIEHTETAFDR